MKAAKPEQKEFTPDEPTNHAIRHMSYLYGRWLDEEGYEEFGEYRKSMRANLPPGSSMTRMTNRPFRVEFVYAGYKYRATANARFVNLERESVSHESCE